jgi:hypothetical protein
MARKGPLPGLLLINPASTALLRAPQAEPQSAPGRRLVMSLGRGAATRCIVLGAPCRQRVEEARKLSTLRRRVERMKDGSRRLLVARLDEACLIPNVTRPGIDGHNHGRKRSGIRRKMGKEVRNWGTHLRNLQGERYFNLVGCGLVDEPAKRPASAVYNGGWTERQHADPRPPIQLVFKR